MSDADPQHGLCNAALTLLSEHHVAEIFNVSVRKLQRDREHGCGPRFVKIGRRIAYRPSDVHEHLDSNSFTSTAEAKLAHAKLRSGRSRS